MSTPEVKPKEEYYLVGDLFTKAIEHVFLWTKATAIGCVEEKDGYYSASNFKHKKSTQKPTKEEAAQWVIDIQKQPTKREIPSDGLFRQS
jgi:hypothetical protein